MVVVHRDPCVWLILGRAGPLVDLGGKFKDGLTGSGKNCLQFSAGSVCICSTKCFKTRLPILLIISIAKVSPSFLLRFLLYQFLFGFRDYLVQYPSSTLQSVTCFAGKETQQLAMVECLSKAEDLPGFGHAVRTRKQEHLEGD